MTTNRRVAILSPFPVELLEGCGWEPVLIPLILEKYGKSWDEIMKEGEQLGFDLNSPAIARALVPILKREKIGKVLILSPVDMRELLTALELWGGADYFVWRVEEGNFHMQREKLMEFLHCKSEPEDRENYGMTSLSGAYDLYKNFGLVAEEKTGKIPIGLLGELPPSSGYFSALADLFRVDFVEFFALMEEQSLVNSPELLLSPLERSKWLNQICSVRKLRGFVFLYYSLSSWQNFEIVYSRELKCPFLALEINESMEFQERELLRLEAFHNTLKGG